MSITRALGGVARQELAVATTAEPLRGLSEGCLYSPGPSAGVWRVAPFRDYIIATRYDGIVSVYQQTPEAIVKKVDLTFHRREALSICVLEDQFLTGSSDGAIGVWRAGGAKPVRHIIEPKSHRTGIYSLVALEGGKIATGACQKPKRVKGQWMHNIKIRDLSSGRFEKDLVGHSGGIAGLKYMDRGVLASASGDGTVRLWSLETSDQIGGHTEHKGYVYAIARLGSNLITGGRDRTVKIFDVSTQKVSGNLVDGPKGIAHDSTVYDVNTSGPLVVTASRDGLVKLWDVRTDKKIQTLSADDGFVYTANFLPNGNIVAGTAGHINDQTKEAVEAEAVAKRGGSTRGFKKPNNAHVVVWDKRV